MSELSLDGVSPYIADSIRKQRLEREQAKVLRETLDELGMDEQTVRLRTHARRVVGGPTAFEEPSAQLLAYRRPEVRQRHAESLLLSLAENAERYADRRSGFAMLRRARMAGVETEYVTRRQIIERDGMTCYLCGRECRDEEIHLDHVIPLSRGGPHCAANLKVACALCNLSKGALTPSEYLGYDPLTLKP